MREGENRENTGINRGGTKSEKRGIRQRDKRRRRKRRRRRRRRRRKEQRKEKSNRRRSKRRKKRNQPYLLSTSPLPRVLLH